MITIEKDGHTWIKVRKDGIESYVAREYLEIPSEGEIL